MLLSTVFKTFWLCCVFQRSPKDTPHSKAILIFLLCLWLLIALGQLQLLPSQKSVDTALLLQRSVFLLLSGFVYTYLILTLAKKTNRYLQTMTTLVACQVILHLVALPIVALPSLFGQEMSSALANFFALIYLTSLVGLSVWQFLINAYIYQHALSVTFGQGVLMSVGLLAFNLIVYSLL